MPEGCDLLEQRSDQRDVIMPNHLTATGVLNIAQRGRWRPETNPSTFIIATHPSGVHDTRLASHRVCSQKVCDALTRHSSILSSLKTFRSHSHPARIRSSPHPAALQMAASPDTRSVLVLGVGSCGWVVAQGQVGWQDGRIPRSPGTPESGPDPPKWTPRGDPPKPPQNPPKTKQTLNQDR